MKRVLLIPSDHGGGRGHVSRCIYLAEYLNHRGNSAAVVLERKHFRSYSRSNIKTFLLDTRPERFVKYQLHKPFKPGIKLKTRVLRKPVFVEFDSLAYQVPRDGYWSPKLVKYRFNNLLKMIESFKPDILIGDTHFLTYLCGRKFDIPVVQITRTAGYPPDPNFLWWKENKLKLIPPASLLPFEELLDELSLSQFAKTEDLLRGDFYIVPASPEIETINVQGNNVIFSGPLTNTTKLSHKIPFFDNRQGHNIYISIGGGAGRSNEKKFFEILLKIFKDKNFNVLMSTGNRIHAKKYNNFADNIHVVDWIHGPSAICKSDLVIYHGGYATTLELLANGKTAIVLPSHSEQEGNGRRLENLNLGKVLHLCHDRQYIKFSWPFGNYNIIAGFEMNLNEEAILDSMYSLLHADHSKPSQQIKKSLLISKNEFDFDRIIRVL